MAVLTLTKLWINLAPTGEAMAYNSAPGRGRQRQVRGDVQTFASGRQRAVVEEGVAGTYGPVKLVLVPLADVQRLESWLGRTVLVRDNFGQKTWGTLFDVDTGEHPDGSGWSPSFTLRLVTYPEGAQP